MATVKDVLQRLIDGLRSLPPRRRTGRRASSSKGPRVVVIPQPGSPNDAGAAAQQQGATASSAPVTIRVATFNAAMFSMAPAVPPAADNDEEYPRSNATAAGAARRRQPKKGILKAQGPASPVKQQQLRVSINLQDGEITASERGRNAGGAAGGAGASSSNGGGGGAWKGKAVAEGARVIPEWRRSSSRRARSVAGVLREVGADIVGLQNVRAEEWRGMRPLADLAEGLGMRYAFAESWSPEYGNAVLSRWPIKRWKAQRVADQSDFRNVLRVTVDVPGAGEVNFHCTHLDHLDEGLRMKQVNSILRSADGHHILAGGLNALDSTDYSADRWADIVKYYEEIGKPTPKTEVMRYLKAKRYVDAKDFAGECEAVVVVAKGQDAQGTCKYGTRVDYILASPNSPYKFVPGSYAVVSSKGTSDHHVVKVDITVGGDDGARGVRRQRIVRISKGSTKGIWAAR
ncbi:unnamed protein product [Urochloa decumbens]|uniref:Endonuclease/exonuclease/phosphatase domain-containing protein n=1 Tax=Urochloa decumbens TaxID=240449 RepID=A0ABC8XR78_9POAL